MKEIKAVLFDMDGTLLPMDQKVFTKGYFGGLCKVAAPTGYITSEKLVEVVWAGTKAMVKNDGSRLNRDVFWDSFAENTQLDADKVRELKAICDNFYTKEFHAVKELCGSNPNAVRAVELARGTGRKVVLASNPVFPKVGQLSRMGWVGLGEAEFDLVTSYDNQRFCKPNPQYYIEICKEIGVSPDECLMVGNDEREDAKAASEAGLDCFLVTDCIIPCEDFHWTGKRGTFEDLIGLLATL